MISKVEVYESWNGNIAILGELSSLAVPDVVQITTFGKASGGNQRYEDVSVSMKKWLFIKYCVNLIYSLPGVLKPPAVPIVGWHTWPWPLFERVNVRLTVDNPLKELHSCAQISRGAGGDAAWWSGKSVSWFHVRLSVIGDLHLMTLQAGLRLKRTAREASPYTTY